MADEMSLNENVEQSIASLSYMHNRKLGVCTSDEWSENFEWIGDVEKCSKGFKKLIKPNDSTSNVSKNSHKSLGLVLTAHIYYHLCPQWK